MSSSRDVAASSLEFQRKGQCLMETRQQNLIADSKQVSLTEG